MFLSIPLVSAILSAIVWQGTGVDARPGLENRAFRKGRAVDLGAKADPGFAPLSGGVFPTATGTGMPLATGGGGGIYSNDTLLSPPKFNPNADSTMVSSTVGPIVTDPPNMASMASSSTDMGHMYNQVSYSDIYSASATGSNPFDAPPQPSGKAENVVNEGVDDTTGQID